ncbi:hypothetical protein MJO28_012848 [Puccinia striiformis f. sp. tritici]|uniref:CBF1-interacting co-repressor CIR N-terminal domain-containing protein n=2 Tax=Puccinia striiformis f. sp. tritici TaxID=168172 RepID=A0A0L0VN30_9BASI|nr:hypothetical protein Pst134EA_024657 [Puccinia striiformis f. sp. tritici]KAI9625302.1 hypothetical protein H4Q26_016324 [Puccinia striiformis f. sp. tritici PST-130]KNF00425.1 hypothetical protein PSTG_06353 [Puccinia striiformis f. sp. tritici PST-78]KAH9445066.1 hypothetical protein Pst134EB_025317 [Puccinia striiformis f. sp. tritici]KAH9453792.1 hypothetical protein Pst134EA_024657 [Puccinia striiformis f. sp. tritici]KAI7940563.1 hypothetical protein MJO28_012848 [Puccinia striiformis
MGKLNILYHKSYHVYNRENVERVKRDELRAELEAEVKTQSTIAANSEARLTLLRNQKQQLKQESSRSKERRIEKALDDQLKGKKSNHKILPKDDDDDQEESIQQSTSSNKTTDNSSIIDPKNGHINFWSGLENQSTSKQFGQNAGLEKNEAYMNDIKKKDEKWEDMITMRLDKPAHELNPWYSQNDLINGEDKKLSDRKLKQKASKDEGFKQQNDPLTFIKKSLYPSSSTKYTNPRKRKERQASRSPSPVPKTLHKSRANESEEEEEAYMPALPPSKKPALSTTHSQSTTAPKILKVDISAERLRAEALLKRHRKNNSSSSFSEMGTPNRSGYSDVYNRHEIDVIKNQSRNRHHPYSSSSRNIKQYRD